MYEYARTRDPDRLGATFSDENLSLFTVNIVMILNTDDDVIFAKGLISMTTLKSRLPIWGPPKSWANRDLCIMRTSAAGYPDYCHWTVVRSW